MSQELSFPEDRTQLQRFQIRVAARGERALAELDAAVGFGVLIAPRRERNARNQQFLVMSGSVVRRTQGASDQRPAIAARESLRAKGAIESIAELFDRLTNDVVFPSVSRAANFLCGRAENGWRTWRLDDKQNSISLSEAFDLDERGKLELRYYEAPMSAVWIPP